MIKTLRKDIFIRIRKGIVCTTYMTMLLLFLFLSSDPILAQSDGDLLKQGEDLYLKAEELFVSSSITSMSENNELLDILEDSVLLFTKVEDQQTKYYWLAKTAYLKGIIEKNSNHHEKAEETFSSSKELITKSLEFGDFGEGYRLMADVEGQLIIYRDLIYKTKFGPGIKNMITKAIDLDSANSKAYLSLAMYYRDAPLIAGGNLKKSAAVLQEMINTTGSDQIDLFSLYLWVDTAWLNSEDNQKKKSECLLMLDLFSNQSDIDSMIRRIERKYTDQF